MTGLRITQTVCFAIAGAGGGAALGASVMGGGLGWGTVPAGIVSGSATSLIQAMSTTAGRALAGEDLDIVDEIAGWGGNLLLGALTGGAGGAIAKRVAGPLAVRLAGRLGSTFAVTGEVLEQTIANALEGGLRGMLQSALTDTAKSMRGGRWDTEEFLDNLATNMIARGFASLIQGRLRVHRDGFRQIAGQGGDQAVLW